MADEQATLRVLFLARDPRPHRGMGADVLATGPEHYRRLLNNKVENRGRMIRDKDIPAES